mmetsp:Transcript_34155/g.80908  ORF Transcript_34155/g.80908 Transcript_34155/m.80908 type:complete len:213 (-) Transcript_34155:115-753(-)
MQEWTQLRVREAHQEASHHLRAGSSVLALPQRCHAVGARQSAAGAARRANRRLWTRRRPPGVPGPPQARPGDDQGGRHQELIERQREHQATLRPDEALGKAGQRPVLHGPGRATRDPRLFQVLGARADQVRARRGLEDALRERGESARRCAGVHNPPREELRQRGRPPDNPRRVLEQVRPRARGGRLGGVRGAADQQEQERDVLVPALGHPG